MMLLPSLMRRELLEQFTLTIFKFVFVLLKALNHLAAEVNAKKIPAVAGKAGLRLPSREKALMGRPCRIVSVSEDPSSFSNQGKKVSVSPETSAPLQKLKDTRVSKPAKGKQITLNLSHIELG